MLLLVLLHGIDFLCSLDAIFFIGHFGLELNRWNFALVLHCTFGQENFIQLL